MPTFNPAQGFRARSANISQNDPAVNFSLGISIPVTTLVLGMPRRLSMLGDQLFRKVPVPWNFSYPKFGLEGHVVKDARRAWGAQIQSSTFAVDRVDGSLRRYTWETMLDAGLMAVANEAASLLPIPGLNIQGRQQTLARRIVELSMEADRATIALASASYSSSPDTDDTLGAGSEFNDPTNGDSRTAVRSMASRVAAAAGGLAISDIDVYLTTSSFEAAQDDPLFIARRQYNNTNAATGADLAAYWGVGNVFVNDATYTSDGSTISSLYGDVAIFRVSQSIAANFDTTDAGQFDSFVAFTWRGAQGALNPYYDDETTSWCFPWQWHEKQASVNTAACGIIRNCHN